MAGADSLSMLVAVGCMPAERRSSMAAASPARTMTPTTTGIEMCSFQKRARPVDVTSQRCGVWRARARARARTMSSWSAITLSQASNASTSGDSGAILGSRACFIGGSSFTGAPSRKEPHQGPSASDSCMHARSACPSQQYCGEPAMFVIENASRFVAEVQELSAASLAPRMTSAAEFCYAS
jgi:hypothetical protein